MKGFLIEQIYEHQYITDNKIAQYIKETESLHKYFTSDFKGIKATSFCGVIKTNNISLLILPKISKYKNYNLNIFLFMILYSHNISNINNFKDQENMFEVFIKLFSSNLLKIINQTGIYKEYQPVIERNNYLKGRLILKDFILKNNFDNKFLSEYDEFNINHKLNQLFIYTIKKLKSISKNKLELIKLENIFHGVEPKFNENIHFNHLNLRFKESYNLAKFLLKHLTNTKVKNYETFSFMFDMDILFEDFMSKIFQEVYRAKLQNSKYFGNLKLQPDVILDNMIIDLKYKIFSEDVKKEDKYQMYIYGNNFEKQNTMLLYPKHLKNIQEDLQLGTNQHKINLFVRTIDLDSELNYKEYIAEIKNRVKKIMEDIQT